MVFLTYSHFCVLDLRKVLAKPIGVCEFILRMSPECLPHPLINPFSGEVIILHLVLLD